MEVTIHDNIFGTQHSSLFLRLYDKFKINGKFHSSFDRKWDTYNNPIENFIDDYLNKNNDGSRYIEYWIRTEWMHIECHQDVEENLFKENSTIITPFYGHVAYLDEESKNAATFIFDENFTSVFVVTPKIGRIAKFRGDLFHYVPVMNFIFDRNPKKIRPKRSVLLFNTWDSRCPLFPSIKCNYTNIIFCYDKDEWFDTVIVYFPIINKISIRVSYMGTEIRRLNKSKVEKFEVSEELKNYSIFNSSSEFKCGQYQIQKI